MNANATALSLFDFTALASGTTTFVPWSAMNVSGGWAPLPDRDLAQSWKARAHANVAALRLAKSLVADGRLATEEERRTLNAYVGFGSVELANGLFPASGNFRDDRWAEIAADVRGVLDDSEYASILRSTQYSHFTPEFVVRALWTAVRALGFEGGRVLEPGCGSGLVASCAPADLAEASRLTGYELEPMAARIARSIHANQDVICQDFTKATPEPGFVLAIGNPPFSTRVVKSGKGAAGRLGFRLHDYFIARSVELLRADGIAAFVTSRGTMDKADSSARAHIASMADLIGAVRLPSGAMNEAGTEVVVDVLILRKRSRNAESTGLDWTELAEVSGDGGATFSVNAYFAVNPDMVLGAHAKTGSAFGETYTCIGDVDNLDARLSQAVARITNGATPTAIADESDSSPVVAPVSVVYNPRAKEGSYVLGGADIYQIENGRPVQVPVKSGRGTVGIFVKHARIIRVFVGVRDALWTVLEAQRDDKPSGEEQAALGDAYDAFVGEFGPLNLLSVTEYNDVDGVTRETLRHPNLQPFLDDPDCWLVASIEEYDRSTRHATRGPVFSQQVIRPPAIRNILTIDDALAVTLEDFGSVNLSAIASHLGIGDDDALEQLGDRVYRNPKTGGLEARDQYLSGQVRIKLAEAQAEAVESPEYIRNVEALIAATPKDISPSDITARLGAPWIPTDVVELFIHEKMNINTSVRHFVAYATWEVDEADFSYRAQSTSEWGTARRHAGKLMHDALNSRNPEIYDTVRLADGKETRVLNAVDTEAAKDKLRKIKDAFSSWIWTEGDRAMRLARIYNDTFNDIAPREFDGSHLTLPGASAAFDTYSHQKRGVWRVISSGATYLAHAVGSGKTIEIAACVMEQKRLGLVTKPMLVVPGHTLAQTSREFLQLYPTARILVADETTFAKEKRQRFMAKATLCDWDCIIVTHSAFKLIPTPTWFEKQIIDEELDALGDALNGVGRSERTTRKRIELSKERLAGRLELLRGRKDDMVTIEDIGIDQLIIDEAQGFRKLSFTTNLGNIKGVDPDGSQKAWDLYVKSRFTALRNPTRSLILASGTPITNTLGEMFSVQRFLQPEALRERGLHEFDAWAASFGETVTELELQPSGQYKPVTRFAEFVNVPELIAMFRQFADVLLQEDLRHLVTVPPLKGGERQIVTASQSDSFKEYQAVLTERIAEIESRTRPVQKGDDILLSVITDGRHAAIDLRLVVPGHENEPGNKLNLLIDNAFRIWKETTDKKYGNDERAGAGQLIFSDLGTPAVAAHRGFSAYGWIKERLVAMGVPAAEIAFMQHYKRPSDKQSLFNAFNEGRVRLIIGSSETMGTGVNVQRRLKALHHLDVPWLPSQIQQREGRIERQGNANDEVEIYAYATLGSMDAQMWQSNARKQKFISMVLKGDRTIRRVEDVGSEANQFAIAKAIASGDPRLMQKAGLDAEIARLRRLRAAHFDDRFAVQNTIKRCEMDVDYATFRAEGLAEDIKQHEPTRGDLFSTKIGETRYSTRKEAGYELVRLLGRAEGRLASDTVIPVGYLGGFEIVIRGRYALSSNRHLPVLAIEFTARQEVVELGDGQPLTALGIVARLESQMERLGSELSKAQQVASIQSSRLAEYRQKQFGDFQFQAELDEKLRQLAEIDEELVAESRRLAEATSKKSGLSVPENAGLEEAVA